MSTSLNNTEKLPGSPADVYALLIHADFLQSRMEAGGGIDPKVVSIDGHDDHDAASGHAAIVTQQAIPASVLPSMAQSMFPGDPVTERTETWRPEGDGYVAELVITVKGAPAKLTGTIAVTADGAGSAYVVEAAATVPIPMFGPKLEGVIVEQLGTILTAEAEYTRSRLT